MIRLCSNLSSRQRVEIVLRGGKADVVPFTIYERKIPQCAAEREMRNRGLCIVRRDVPACVGRMPNVKVHRQIEYHDGKEMTRTVYETPVGTVSMLVEAAGFTSWVHEKLFKSPEDYKVLRFLAEDEQFAENYAAFAQAQAYMGDDAILRATIGLEPLQMLISSSWMDMAEFCMQWMENRDEVLKVYQALVENRRRQYPLVAQSPALHANYGGNVVVDMIGLSGFKDYYLPNYQEAAEVLHKHGKLLGSHFDGNCKLLAPLIGESALDYIEAFTPAPDTDLTLKEARKAWPSKVIWMNFPSSVHLASDEMVERTAFDLLEEAGSLDGLIMGITEDIPEFRWRNSCRAIMDGLERHVRTCPDRYRGVAG